MAIADSLAQLKDLDVSELDLNNIGTWPAAIKFIVLAVLFLIMVGGGYYLYLSEKRVEFAAAEVKEGELRKEYESKRFQAANLDAYRAQRDEMEATFGALLRQLPSDTEVPGLIEDITRTALENDLTIESIDLKPERRANFYMELPIDITVEGDYHKIGSFVSAVSNLSRIVTLHDFTIRPLAGPTSLKMSIVAKTYRYVEEA